MKKLRSGIIKTISILFSLLFVCSFVLVGCTFGTTRAEDGSVYNEAGGFYEIEDNEAVSVRRYHGMNDYTSDEYLNFNFDKEDIFYTVYSSSDRVAFWGGTMVPINESDNQIVDKSNLEYTGPTLVDQCMQYKKGDRVHFGICNPGGKYTIDELLHTPFYIEIIARKDNDIIGYGLIAACVPNYYYPFNEITDKGDNYKFAYLQEDGSLLFPNYNDVLTEAIPLQNSSNYYLQDIGEDYHYLYVVIPFTLVKFAWLSENEIGKVTKEMIYFAIEASK